jgi:hypothetical protein
MSERIDTFRELKVYQTARDWRVSRRFGVRRLDAAFPADRGHA